MRARSPLVAANDNFPARLLTKSQAASYCGLSLPTFGSVCPVRPIALGVGVRMERYDVHEIDGWIDGLRNAGKPLRTAEALLDAL
jgi:predicted DNA-binding transcriptional regulator AlpA